MKTNAILSPLASINLPASATALATKIADAAADLIRFQSITAVRPLIDALSELRNDFHTSLDWDSTDALDVAIHACAKELAHESRKRRELAQKHEAYSLAARFHM